MLLIWGLRQAEYFSQADWTRQIGLKGLAKLIFRRRRSFECRGHVAPCRISLDYLPFSTPELSLIGCIKVMIISTSECVLRTQKLHLQDGNISWRS